jgi:MFS transporter, ACS family, glucarate transporter
VHAPYWSLRVRWKIFGFMFAFALLGQVERNSLSIAAAHIMPELKLSQLQIGWLEEAFLIGYTIFQLPGGLFGQRLGARRTLVIIGLAAWAAMIAMALAPELFVGTTRFLAMLTAQLSLGVALAALYPVSTGVFETWFPPRQWGLVQGLQTVGSLLGAAIAPALVASLMVVVGWQRALVYASLPAIVLVALWGWYGRNSPREHAAVSAAELAELSRGAVTQIDRTIGLAKLLPMMVSRNVMLLTFSYLCMNYAFYLIASWRFLYLVQERHFSVLESGWLATLPALCSAIAAGLGGALADALCRRYGVRWGLRLIPLVALPAAGVLLLVAVGTVHPYGSVVAIASCFACLELTEGPYWAAVMNVGRENAMAASGVMNTGGNAGGILAIPVIAYLSGHQSWHAAFLIAACFAIAAAIAWLGIDGRRSEGAESKGTAAIRLDHT